VHRTEHRIASDMDEEFVRCGPQLRIETSLFLVPVHDRGDASCNPRAGSEQKRAVAPKLFLNGSAGERRIRDKHSRAGSGCNVDSCGSQYHWVVALELCRDGRRRCAELLRCGPPDAKLRRYTRTSRNFHAACLSHMSPLLAGCPWYLAIIGITLSVRLVLVPVAIVQMRNVAKMILIKPDMERITKRWKVAGPHVLHVPIAPRPITAGCLRSRDLSRPRPLHAGAGRDFGRPEGHRRV